LKQGPTEEEVADNLERDGKNLVKKDVSIAKKPIGLSHAQYLQSVHANSSDVSVFLKHGEIKEKFSLKLDFIRDLKNSLELITPK